VSAVILLLAGTLGFITALWRVHQLKIEAARRYILTGVRVEIDWTPVYFFAGCGIVLAALAVVVWGIGNRDT
jgi:hypothetical protein